MGEDADVTAWTAAEATYRKSIIAALTHVYQKEGYIRSGLYDWTPGWIQGRVGGARTIYCNQDWENNLLVYPTELLAPDDPMVATSLAEIRRRKYREGVMAYRNGMHIHQYATINQAQQYRAIGDQQQYDGQRIRRPDRRVRERA